MDDQNTVNGDNLIHAHQDNQTAVGGLGAPPQEPQEESLVAPTSAPPSPVASKPPLQPAASDDSQDTLADIKVRAITQLTPLVKHLDQSPEERFKTMLMMIQVSDNQDLIKDAYEVAEQIEDEKAKAQALLDIVNEINYFTKDKN